jgi:hypothetical protein
MDPTGSKLLHCRWNLDDWSLGSAEILPSSGSACSPHCVWGCSKVTWCCDKQLGGANVRRILFFLTMSVCSSFIAGQPAEPPPNAAAPTVTQVAGRNCDASKPDVRLTTQDPVTGYWSGKVYAQSYCVDEDLVHHGCASITVDPTGTALVSYQLVWQETVGRDDKDKRDGNRTCFTDATGMAGSKDA